MEPKSPVDIEVLSLSQGFKRSQTDVFLKPYIGTIDHFPILSGRFKNDYDKLDIGVLCSPNEP